MLWDFLKRNKPPSGNGSPREDVRSSVNGRGGGPRPDRARADKMISSGRVQIERKQFFFDFKENASGKFLRITEDVGGHRDTIIVPATGLQMFRESLDRIIAEDVKTASR